MAGPRNPIARAILRMPVLIFQLRLGAIFGGRMLLLETVGRTTGRVRRTVIEVVRADPPTHQYWVIAAWGRESDWYRNALANPPRVVDTGRDRLVAPSVHELNEPERLELLREYQAQNPRVAKVLGDRLLGREFTSDADALRALAAVIGALRFSAAPAT
jgi:deazaflavin-dependent oxidoreductase (nitroreductase family)